MIEDKDGYINSIQDPLQRKKEKLMFVFDKDQELLINRHSDEKIDNTKRLADRLEEYTLYFETQEHEMRDDIKINRELTLRLLQKYKRTPFLEVMAKPDILKNNITYRRYFVNHIEKLLESSSSTSNSIITGNHKLYAILHSNNGKDVNTFEFMETIREIHYV